MGVTLTGKTIASTYTYLLKVSGNSNIGSSIKKISDGDGNEANLYLSTTQTLVGAGSVSVPSLAIYGSTTTGLYSPNANQLGISIAGSQKALFYSGGLTLTGDISVSGGFKDSNNTFGTSGQVLASTGSGTDWVNLSEISGIDGSGTLNTIPKFTPDGNTIGDSTITDDGTNVTIAANVKLGDSKIINLGSGNDLQIFHNGTDGSIRNFEGDLILRSADTDKDIIFQADDGSGSVTTYFFLDGSSAQRDSNNNLIHLYTVFPDKSVAGFGDDIDLKIYRGSSKSYIEAIRDDLSIESIQGKLSLISPFDDTEIYSKYSGGGYAHYLVADASDYKIKLFFDGSQKLETNNDGIEVTGDVEADEFIGDLRGAVLFIAQAGEALTKGDVVYISGISGTTTVVSKADNDAAGKMPAFGLVNADASLNASCEVVTFGTLSGIDTSSYSEGDELYVSQFPAGLQNTKPAGESRQVQKIAKVTRSHATAGSVKVIGAGRVNDTPNLDNGNIFIGNSSNEVTTVSLSSEIETAGDNRYLQLTGGTLTGNLLLQDSVILDLGSDNDLRIHHSGTTGVIGNRTGDLFIQNGANDSDIIFKSDDGSGGLATYFTIDGGVEQNVFSKDIVAGDNIYLRIGNATDGDLQIFHDGTNDFIRSNGTYNIFEANNHIFRNLASDEDYAKFLGNGAVELYYNNSKKFETRSTGVLINSTGAGAIATIEAGDANQASVDLKNTEGHYRLITDAGELKVYDQTDSRTSFLINTSGNASFAGDVTIGGTSSESRTLTLQTNSEKDSVINLKEGSANYGFSIGYYGVANDFIIKRHDNSASGTDVFTLYRENNHASFAGNITTTGNLMPSADSTHNIGSNSVRWDNVYADNLYGIVDKLSVTSNDTFTGTYSLLWHSGNVVYSSSFMTINGATDTLSVPNISTTGDVTIGGDLTVSGTTTTIDTTNLDVKDKNITLNYGTGDTSANADGAGITIQDAVDASTDATILWDQTNAQFDFNQKVHVTASGSILLLLENSATSGADSKIRIRGARNAQTYSDGSLLSSVVFSNHDSDDSTVNHDLGEIGVGMYDGSGNTGYLRLKVNNGSGLQTALDIDKNKNAKFYGKVGIGSLDTTYNLYNNGTSYFNDEVYVDHLLRMTDMGRGLTYAPQESGVTQNRYFIMFDNTNDASYPFLTNRTPSGAVVIKTGTAAAGGENEHFRIKGGDGTVDAYFTDTNLGLGTSSPDTTLHVVKDSSNSQLTLQRTGTATGKYEIYTNNNSLFIYDRGQTALRAMIDSSGNFLVNKTAAGVANVGVEARAVGQLFATRDGDNVGYFNRKTSDGHVIQIRKDNSTVGVIGTQDWGIGTASPARTLDVRGDAQILSTGATGLRIVGGATNEVYMIFGDADDNSMGGFGYDNNTDTLTIDVNNAERINIASDGTIKFNSYGAGYLKTDANGVISVDTSTIEDTLQTVTDRGSTTTNAISTGDITVDNKLNFTGTSYQISGGSSVGDMRFVAPRFRFYEDSISGTAKLEIDGGNATFAGTVTADNIVKATNGGSEHAYLMAAATGTGVAGMYLDASNGDFSGGDYFSIVQKNDLSVEFESRVNAGNLIFKSKGSTNLTMDGANSTFEGRVKGTNFTSIENSTDGGFNITRDYLRAGTGDRGGGLIINDISGARFAMYAGGYDLTFSKETDDGAGSVSQDVWMRANAANAASNVASIDFLKESIFAGDVTVSGNLTVNGTETILNTETVEVEDNVIVLNKTGTSMTATTSGIEIYRGASAAASFIFDDSDDYWDLTHNLKVAGSTYLDGFVTIDHNLDITSSGVIRMGGTEVISAARAINATSGTFLAKGTQLGDSGYYINSTFKDTGDNVGVFLAHDDTANGTGAIAGINQLAFLTYGSAWTQALLLDSNQKATFAGNLTVQGSSDGIRVDSAGHATLSLDRGSTSYDNNLIYRTNGTIKWRLWQDGSDDYLYIRDEANASNIVTFQTGGNTTFADDVRIDGDLTHVNNQRENVVSSGTAASYQYLDTRDYMVNKGDYATSTWVVPPNYSGSVHRVSAFEDNTNVYIDDVYHTTIDKMSNTEIAAASLSDFSKITADKPIIVHVDNPESMPINTALSSTKLGAFTNRYHPTKFYMYSPFGKTDVKIYESTSAPVDISGTPTYTTTIAEGAGVTVTGTNHGDTTARYYVIVSELPICGSYAGNATSGDYMLLSPIGMEILGTAYAADNYWGFNDGTTTSSVNIKTGDASAKFLYDATGKNGVFAASTADGAGGDAEFCLPLEYLSDTYIYVHNTITNFRLASYKSNTIKVLDKNDNVVYTIDHTSATKEVPQYHQEGNAAGNGADINSNGPFKFVGSSPFYLVCQEGAEDAETVMLGALQSSIVNHQSFDGGVVPNRILALDTGSTNSPTYSFDGNASTGMMSRSTNNLEFVTAGSLALNFYADQSAQFLDNVGIGVAPTYPLTINTGAGTFSVRSKGSSSVTLASSASLTYFGDTHEFYNSAGDTEFFRVDSSGQFLIDTTGTTGANIKDGAFLYRNDNNSYLQFVTGTNNDTTSLYLYRKNSADNGVQIFGKIGNSGLGLTIGSGGNDNTLILDADEKAIFAGNVDVDGGELKISGNFAKLFFEDTAGTDEDAYIVNNANGLFFGKTNSPSGSNDILSLDLSNKKATFAGDLMMLSGTGGTTSKIIFKRTDNASEATFIRTNAYWNEYGAHANEGHKFIDSSSNILLQLNGGNSSSGNGALSATFAGGITTTSTSGLNIDTTGNALAILDGDVASTQALIFKNSGTEVSRISHAGNDTSLVLYTGSSVQAALTLDSSQKAIFAGLVQGYGPAGTSRADTHGISLYSGGNTDYRISFDSIGGTVGYIRYNVDTAGSSIHGHIFSAGDFSGTPTDLMIIRADGKVGISTDSPARDFHLKKSNSGGQVRAEVFNTSNTADSHGIVSIYSGGASAGDPFLHWKVEGVQDWSMGIDNSDSDKLKISKTFGVGTNDYLTIDGSSNVEIAGKFGIGVSPTVNLDIRGTVNTDDCKIYLKENDTYGAFFKYDGVTNEGYIGGITGGTSENDVLTWSRDGSKLVFLASGSEKMRLNSTGLGIGTDDPIGDLTISDGGGTGLEIFAQDANTRVSILSYDRIDNAYREINLDGYNFNFRTSGNIQASILNDGKIGFGSQSPQGKVHITDTSTQLVLETPNSTNDIDFRWREDGVNKWNMRYQNSGNHLQFLNQTGTSLTQLSLNADGSSTFEGDVVLTSSTDSPMLKLQVDGVTSDYGLKNVGGEFQIIHTTTDTPLVKMDSSGNMGIDTGNASIDTNYSLQVHGAMKGASLVLINDGSGVILDTQDNGGTSIFKVESEVVTLGEDNQFRASRNTTTDSIAAATASFIDHNTGSGNRTTIAMEANSYQGAKHISFYGGANLHGSISAGYNATAYNTSSDYRLKENVNDLSNALTKVDLLLPKTFTWKGGDDSIVVEGFLAHEAQEVVPQAVTGTKDETDESGNAVYQGIDQSKLVPLLTAAIKELKAQNEELLARIEALENN